VEGQLLILTDLRGKGKSTMRKVTVTGTFRMTLNVDEGIEIQQALDSIEIRQVPWEAKGCTQSFDIEDATLENYEITDSR
jgi:hypothetical protein